MVMRIAATDVDAGENARISYVWDPNSGSDADYFDVDRATGTIHLKKKITVRFFEYILSKICCNRYSKQKILFCQ